MGVRDLSHWSRCPDCGDMIDVHPLVHQIMEHAPRLGSRERTGERNWRTGTLTERNSDNGVDVPPERV